MGEREDVRWTADKGKMEKKRKRQMIDGCVFVCLHESERERREVNTERKRCVRAPLEPCTINL